MKFGILKNGMLNYAPKNYKNSNGNFIVNFNKNEELMKSKGYKIVIEEKPDYNNISEYITISGYEETEDRIIVKYEIRKIEISESHDEKINKLDKNIKKILKALKKANISIEEE